MKKLKTGDVVRFKHSDFSYEEGDSWAVIWEFDGISFPCRSHARYFKAKWQRIAKILKITPKTVTVQISK